jgi:hypothetical protein
MSGSDASGAGTTEIALRALAASNPFEKFNTGSPAANRAFELCGSVDDVPPKASGPRVNRLPS